MAARLVILGAGGNAGDILDIVAALNAVRPDWEVMGLLDDGLDVGVVRYGQRVLGPVRAAAEFPAGTCFVNAIGSQATYRARASIVASTGLPDSSFPALVHPGASVSRQARVASGSYVCFAASVGPGASIGRHVHVGVGAILGHDCAVADFALIAPGVIASGFVRIAEAAYVGAGACLRQNVSVGAGALVGMGSVVLADVEPESTVAGNPARRLVRHDRPVRTGSG